MSAPISRIPLTSIKIKRSILIRFGKGNRVAPPPKVHILGIGDDGLDGLTPNARRIIDDAQMLLGDEQTMAATKNQTAQRVEIGTDLEALVRRIANTDQSRIV